jgi:hypothetical protein
MLIDLVQEPLAHLLLPQAVEEQFVGSDNPLILVAVVVSDEHNMEKQHHKLIDLGSSTPSDAFTEFAEFWVKDNRKKI